MFLLLQLQSKSFDTTPCSGIGLCLKNPNLWTHRHAHTHTHLYTLSIPPRVLTNRPGSLPDLPMIGGRVSVGVTVVMGDGHVIQPVVLRRERARVGQAVRLVGEPIGWAEALGGAYGAGPLVRVNIWVKGTISLEAVLFGSGWRKKDTFVFALYFIVTASRICVNFSFQWVR